MPEISIKKNFLYSMGYQLLVLITPFITAPYVSRVLGADGVGIYSYSSSIVSYFTLFAGLGTASYGSREIARNRDDKYKYSKIFWEIELMTIFTSCICLAVWIIVIIVNANYRFYFMALTPVILGTMFDISWFFTGHEQMKYIVLRNSICKIVGIVLLFCLVRDKDDVIVYMLINSVITLFGSLSMWTYLPKFVQRVDIKQLRFKNHFKETMIYFIPTIATSIYTLLDKTLIGLITHNEYENGYYEQATKIVNIAKALVFTSVNTVMGARISYLFAEEKYAEIHRRIEKSVDFILLIGFACVFGIIGVARTFVPVFFGKGYDPVIRLLYIFAPIIVIIGISNCLGSQYYTPSGQRARSAKYIIAGSVVNFCLNIVFIPQLGSNGAAVASIIAELVITVLYMSKCDGYVTVSMLIVHSWKRLLAGGIMCFLVALFGEILAFPAIVTLCLQVAIGVVSYIVLLWAMNDILLKELVREVLAKLTRKNKQ